MLKHLREMHPDDYTKYLNDRKDTNKDKMEKIKANKELEKEVNQGDDELEELRGTFAYNKKRPVTTPITKYLLKQGGSAKYRSNSDLQRRAEMDLAIYLVTGNLSFNHIETKAFRRFVETLNPKVTVKSRSSLVKTTLPLLERNLREAKDRLLDEHMPKVPGASFTSDIWSSKSQNSYLSLTMHFIDGNWKLHNLTMGVTHLEDPSHTAAVICSKLEAMIEEIPLPEQATVSFTTDGASSMIKAMRESPLIHEHVVCFCHTISNSLQEAFSNPVVEPSVQKLKDLAGATHKSIKRITAIRRVCNDLEIPFVRIILPVKTRWNSLVMCLQTVVRISPALKKLREEKLPIFEDLIPTDKQLNAFEEMLGPLLMIKQASELLEREDKPTIHMVLPLMIKLTTISKSTKFSSCGRTTRAVIEAFEAALSLRIKDNGRHLQVVCIANLLHPSYKGALLNALDKDYYDDTVAGVKDMFPEVNPDPPETEQEDSQSILPSAIPPGWDDGFEGVQNQMASSQSASQLSSTDLSVIEREIEVWQHTVKGFSNKELDVDILGFWKKNAGSLPNLAWLARRVLSVPASSTSSERAFSTGGKVVSASRTLLNADRAESLIWMMENFDELDPLIPKYVLRSKDFKKRDKALKKVADKEKEVQDESYSTSSAESDPSEANYESDGVVSIHDSDD